MTSPTELPVDPSELKQGMRVRAVLEGVIDKDGDLQFGPTNLECLFREDLIFASSLTRIDPES